jgi:hypothetical protein
MTLAQVGARKLAYTILELERGEREPEWLKSEYNRSHRANIRQHIQFAEFWYAGNGRFTDLNDFCAQIAQDAGLKLTPEDAFQWIGTGGFAEDTFSDVNAISCRFSSSRLVIGKMIDSPDWVAARHNVYRLNLDGAEKGKVAFYEAGTVKPVNCLRRGDKVLPLVNQNLLVYSTLQEQSDAVTVAQGFQRFFQANPQRFPNPQQSYSKAIEALETMISHGWVEASVNPGRPFIPVV